MTKKFVIIILFITCNFLLLAQNNVKCTISKRNTLIEFENTSVDTTLYFIGKDAVFFFINSDDTCYLKIKKENIVFRDFQGLRIQFQGNCQNRKVQISYNHPLFKTNQHISSVFNSAYRQLFVNFNSQNYTINDSILMLIVCYSDFISSLDEFIIAKKSEGIQCVLFSIDTDSLLEIQEKIVDYYHSLQPDYLLIIGDNQQIPTYNIDEGLSDCMYSMIDGDDVFPEMITGRISAENVQELRMQLSKIIIHNSQSSTKTAIGIASNNYSITTDSSDWEYMRDIRKDLLNKGFQNVYELYDGSQKGEDADGNPTIADVMNGVNQGTTLINYIGNGSYDGWETTSTMNQDLDNLNNLTIFPIVLSAACLNGYFADRTCLAEKWMRAQYNNNSSGAVATLMFSSLVDWDASRYGLQKFNTALPNCDSNIRLGNLYLSAYIQMIIGLQRQKDAKTWVLFGDPSMWVYSKIPQEIIALKKQKVQCYPNPTYQNIVLESTDIIRKVQIFDNYGKQLKTIKGNNSNMDISLDEFQAAVYLIKIIFEDNSFIFNKITKL